MSVERMWTLRESLSNTSRSTVTGRKNRAGVAVNILNRPEREAAMEYLRRKGTEAPASTLASKLRITFQQFEQDIERVPEGLRAKQPDQASWSIHEIVDHLVESDRPAVAELRALCAGVSPVTGPIPARLKSPRPFDRPWSALVGELKNLHAQILDIVINAGDQTPTAAKAPVTMVIKVPGPSGPEVLEWIDAVDWKAYAQTLRIHTHEHRAQVERTLTALAAAST